MNLPLADKDQVLFVNVPGHQPLPAADVLRIASDGATIHSVTDPSAAVEIISHVDGLRLVMSNAPVPKVFEAARQEHPKSRSLLVTSHPMEVYSRHLEGAEDRLVDHVIANRRQTNWTINEIRVTIRKLLSKEIFGLEKYLAPGSKVHSFEVKNSSEREEINDRVMRFAEECRLGSHICKMIWGISEELLMNAIYDAPEEDGKKKYHFLPRSTPVELEPHEYARISFACDGQVFIVGSQDPFGLLRQDKLFQYVKKVISRMDSDSIIDTKKGGAGLGLFKILYSSHALVCNVEPKQKTEIMALIDVTEQLRDFSKMARSIHYFESL